MDEHILSMVKRDRKMMEKGIIIHHITNPKALVENMMNELQDKDKVKIAIQRMLGVFIAEKKLQNHWITLVPEIRDLVLAIFKKDVFMEFYNEKTSKIAASIHIKSKNIANDLGIWFTSFDKNKKHDPEQDYLNFKKEIEKEFSNFFQNH
ncbi:hypothetical protein ACFL2V_15015 [Pseudomonadota bacterium]